jgi:signal transduction histidine kinase
MPARCRELVLCVSSATTLPRHLLSELGKKREREAFRSALAGGLTVASTVMTDDDSKKSCDDQGGSDVRHRKAAKEDQRRSVRLTQRLTALGEMTAGIVHDLRNVLAVIDAGLSLAEKNANDPEKVRAYIAKAREAVGRRTKAISQLLNFAADKEIETRPGDMNSLIEKLAPFLEYGAGPGVRLTFDLAQGLPECRIDAAQFSSAILNLVTNARDAMPNGGDILIHTDRCLVEKGTPGPPSPGPYVLVRVKDCGKGMPPDVLRQVLDPFFTTKGEKGTGLGLPQVSAFVRTSGGHLSIASEQGLGTTIDLLFPSIEQGS